MANLEITVQSMTVSMSLHKINAVSSYARKIHAWMPATFGLNFEANGLHWSGVVWSFVMNLAIIYSLSLFSAVYVFSCK